MLLIHLLVLFICLFILYAISRHDFVFLRQNINLRKVFDNAFIIMLTSFLASRIAYVYYSEKLDLLNPFKFFYISKYWGVIPFLGFIFMGLTIYILFRKKKNILRVFDIYLISFSPLILLDILLQNNSGISLYIKGISAVVLSAFYFWFVKINNKFALKDGFMTSIIYITYALVSLAFSFSSVGFLNFKYLWFQIILGISLLFFSVMLVLVQKESVNK